MSTKKKTSEPGDNHLKVSDKYSEIVNDMNKVLKKHGLNALAVDSLNLRDTTNIQAGCHIVCEHRPDGTLKCWMEC